MDSEADKKVEVTVKNADMEDDMVEDAKTIS